MSNVKVSEAKLRSIAGECREFDHVIQSMGYGYSLANVAADEFIRRCSDCVRWEDGHCPIFLRESR